MKLLYVCFLVFGLFRATPTAYGSPRLGVQSKLKLPAYTTATATPDPSCIFNLLLSSRQHHVLNPLSEAWDQTRVLMDASQVGYH